MTYKSSTHYDFFYDKMDVHLKHPFSMLVSGGRGVGKTEFTKSLLKSRHKMIQPAIHRIVWC